VFVFHGGAGGVSVLDAASGALQRNIDLGRIPRAVVVDAQARRAVVISGRGAASAPDAWDWVPPLLRRSLPFLSPPGAHTHIVPSSVTILDTSHL
jgi:hypothetical protein